MATVHELRRLLDAGHRLLKHPEVLVWKAAPAPLGPVLLVMSLDDVLPDMGMSYGICSGHGEGWCSVIKAVRRGRPRQMCPVHNPQLWGVSREGPCAWCGRVTPRGNPCHTGSGRPCVGAVRNIVSGRSPASWPLWCRDCGDMLTGFAATLRKRPTLCHVCNRSKPVVDHCPSCGTERKVYVPHDRDCADCARRKNNARGSGEWIPPEWRQFIHERDSYVCQICLEPTDPEDCKWRDGVFIVGKRYPVLDHIVRKREGGSDHPINLRTAHHACNSARG